MAVPKVMSPASSPATSAKALELKKIHDFYSKNGHIPTILAQESQKRFGTASSADVSELGKQVALGKMTKEQALNVVRGGSKSIDDLNRRAGMSTSLEIDPQELALKNNLAALDAAFKQSSAQSTATGNATVARQKAIYDQLQSRIAAEPAAIQQNYGNTIKGVDQQFTGAIDSTKQNYADAIQAQNNEAARLGLEAATPVANQQGNNDANFIQGLLQSQKLGADSTLANLQQASINDSNSAGHAAGQESAALQAGTIGDFAQRMQEAINAKLAQEGDYNSQIQQLEATRAPKLYETLQGLQAARQQQLVDAQDRQFQQDIAAQTLGVKQTEAQTHQYAAQTDRQKVEVASKKTMAELQKIQRESMPGTLEYETARAAIELKKAQAAATLTNAKTGIQNANTNATKVTNAAQAAADKAANATAKYGKGMAGVQKYLKDSNVDPQVFTMVMKHVANTIATHKTGDYANGLRGVEGYIAAHKLSPEEANIFRIATSIAYGQS